MLANEQGVPHPPIPDNREPSPQEVVETLLARKVIDLDRDFPFKDKQMMWDVLMLLQAKRVGRLPICGAVINGEPRVFMLVTNTDSNEHRILWTLIKETFANQDISNSFNTAISYAGPAQPKDTERDVANFYLKLGQVQVFPEMPDLIDDEFVWFQDGSDFAKLAPDNTLGLTKQFEQQGKDELSRIFSQVPGIEVIRS